MKRLKRKIGLLLLLALISVNSLQAGYIYAKAVVAQVLIKNAWQSNINSGNSHTPWPWADTYPVAKLSVPRLAIEQYVLAGSSGNSLAFGPGWLLGSGEIGKATSIIAGHKDTHFRFTQHLKIGDAINLQSSDGQQHQYRVTTANVVNTDTQALRLGDNQNRMVLISCYPFNAIQSNAKLRYVVTAEPLHPSAELL